MHIAFCPLVVNQLNTYHIQIIGTIKPESGASKRSSRRKYMKEFMVCFNSHCNRGITGEWQWQKYACEEASNPNSYSILYGMPALQAAGWLTMPQNQPLERQLLRKEGDIWASSKELTHQLALYRRAAQKDCLYTIDVKDYDAIWWQYCSSWNITPWEDNKK